MRHNEVVKFLEFLGTTKIKIQGDQLTACCPIHGERRPSFGVALDKPGHPFNCFSCHASGVLPKVAMEVKGMTWKEALSCVRKFGDFDLDLLDSTPDNLIFERRFQEDEAATLSLEYLSSFDYPNLRAKAFLKGRGVKRSTAVAAGIRTLNGRMIFPWYVGKLLVGMTTRSYRNATDPMRGLPLFGFKKHQKIYRAFGADPKPRQRVCIMEGELDALRVQSFGVDSTALSGTMPTRSQVDDLCTIAEQVVLLFDNDKPGRDATEALQRMAQHRLMLLRPTVLPNEYSDPGAASRDLLNTMLNDDALEVCL